MPTSASPNFEAAAATALRNAPQQFQGGASVVPRGARPTPTPAPAPAPPPTAGTDPSTYAPNPFGGQQSQRMSPEAFQAARMAYELRMNPPANPRTAPDVLQLDDWGNPVSQSSSYGRMPEAKPGTFGGYGGMW